MNNIHIMFPFESNLLNNTYEVPTLQGTPKIQQMRAFWVSRGVLLRLETKQLYTVQ